MPSSGSAFALASNLRARTDAELVELLKKRDIREAGISDFFDLAERLLDRSSIQAMLSQIDRRALLSLFVASDLSTDAAAVSLGAIEQRIREIDHPESLAFPSTLEARIERLAQLALLHHDAAGVVVFDAVRDQLASWPSIGLPGIDGLSSRMPQALVDLAKVDQDATDSLAAEKAFSTSVSLVELIAALRHEGARELARGGIGLPDSKRLALASGVPIELVAPLMTIGWRARLLDMSDGRWKPTEHADEWAVLPLAKRWAVLAGGWVNRIAEDTRYVLADRAHAIWGEHFDEYMSWLYPAADAPFRQRMQDAMLMGEMLGTMANRTPSTAGSALVARGADAAGAAMATLLPPEIENVYLQHDLSVVSPGPLAPRVDARLREMTTVESRALASTFRISAESITRALANGDTEESIFEFLSGISLTGIPQPLRYLVTETAARYGMLKVGKVVEGADSQRVSFVRTEDDELLATVLVDRRLSPLGLRRVEDGLATSRFERDIVYLALVDAKYPAVAVNSSGDIVIVEHRGGARDLGAGHVTPRHPAASIVEKIRHSATATEGVSSTAWLERQLEVAIRSKLSVTVTVTMPDGSLQDYVLEPTGLSSGRLRARDRKADIERTLPLSRITVVSEIENK